MLKKAFVFALSMVGAPAMAEAINLSCAFEQHEERITLDFDAGVMRIDRKYFSTLAIVDSGPYWVIARISLTLDTTEKSASSETWILRRRTGEVWKSVFGNFTCEDPCPGDNFDLITYKGQCRQSGF